MTDAENAADPEAIERPSAKDPEPGVTDAATANDTEELARHREPSLVKASDGADGRVPGRGVVWVRPSDLIHQVSGHVAGRGIDFQAELARRARRLSVQTVAVSRKGISDRAAKLSPLSAFGYRRMPPPASAVRSGIATR
jgi:hypothetical protein